MKSKLIIIVIIAIVASIFLHKDIYRFQMVIYHKIIKGENLASIQKKSKILFKEKKNLHLKDYLKTMLVIYPENKELIQLSGLNYISLNQKKKGAYLILQSIDEKNIDKKKLLKAIKIFFDEKMYGDITGYLEKYNHYLNYNLKTYYGKSLYYMKRYDKALVVLQEAAQIFNIHSPGEMEIELSYYIGLIYEKKDDFRKAIKYVKFSRDKSKKNADYNKTLVRLYNKAGQFSEAEKIIRELKHY